MSLALPLTWVTVVDGQPQVQSDAFNEWILAAQDCELAWKAITDDSSDVLIELRPLLRDDPPTELGIRSQKFLVDTDGTYVDNNLPRLTVHPNVLAYATHLTCPVNPRRFKTWLGLRYDRPAIPQGYVKLSELLVKKAKVKRTRDLAEKVRDLLVTFRTGPEGQVYFELVGVLSFNATKLEVEKVLDWVSSIALEIPESLGIAELIDARPDTQVSLAFVERSFVLDASSLSWPPNRVGPIGEFRP
ncbi:hypothetical protein [Streptomyces sp. NBC_00467]|uniref:hypothetical protein n=1 Tax=Streptomyces sp. NBC_00467 TaxID=2975752 RepID=UPI002E18B3C3